MSICMGDGPMSQGRITLYAHQGVVVLWIAKDEKLD